MIKEFVMDFYEHSFVSIVETCFHELESNTAKV